MADDPRVDKLSDQLDRLRDKVAEIDRSGTKITQREIEHLWVKARELTGDIAHLDEELEKKADKTEINDLKANYRTVRNIVLAAVAAVASSVAYDIFKDVSQP